MRLIDADALDKDVLRYASRKHFHGNIEEASIILKTRQVISDAPTIDAEPVRHGVWNENIVFNKREYPAFPVKRGYICSLCGRKERKKEPYCHCGAKMEGNAK